MEKFQTDLFQLHHLIDYLIQNYLQNSFAVCFLWDQSKDSLEYFSPFHWNSSNFMLINYEEHKNFDNLLVESLNKGCQSFFVTTSVVLYFLNVHQKIQDLSVQRNAVQYLIVLPGVSTTDRLFDDILVHPAMENILNTLVVVPNKDYLKLKTNKVAGNTKQSLLLDTYYPCNKTFAKNSNLFPQKWMNLEQKIQTCIFYNFPPYDMWHNTKENEGSVQEINSNKSFSMDIAGTEGLLAKDFIKKYNISLHVTIGKFWKSVNSKGENVGIVNSVINHEANFSLAALFAWYPDSLYVAISCAIRKSSVSVLVPKPRLLPAWKILILPFLKLTWMAVFVFLCVGIISLKYVEHYAYNLIHQGQQNLKNNFSKTVLTVFAIIMMQSINVNTNNKTILLIISTLFFFGLIISSAYSGGLASVMNVPQYEKPITTIDDFLESGLNWATDDEGWISSISLDENPKYQELIKRFLVLTESEMEKRVDTYDLAFGLERLEYGSYAVTNYFTVEAMQHLRKLNEDFYWAYSVAMSPKNWPLMPMLNDLILDLTAFGIQDYYERITSIEILDSKIQQSIRYSGHRETAMPKQLTPMHLSGAFFLLMIGNAIASFIFCCEMLLYRCLRKNIVSTTEIDA